MSEVVSMQWTEAEIVGINQDRVSYHVLYEVESLMLRNFSTFYFCRGAPVIGSSARMKLCHS